MTSSRLGGPFQPFGTPHAGETANDSQVLSPRPHHGNPTPHTFGAGLPAGEEGTPPPSSPATFSDPRCKITAPGHVCRRRDGQRLNGTNGDCWPSARIDSIRYPILGWPPCTCGSLLGCEAHGPQPRDQSVPCTRCRQPTFALDAICEHCHTRETQP